MNLKALVYLLFLIGSSAMADTNYILMDGGVNKNSNYYRFYGEMRKGYETLKSIGTTPSILAKDGSWRTIPQIDETLSNFSLTPEARATSNNIVSNSGPSYPPISSSIRGLEDIEKKIQDLNLKSGDSLVLFITSHGGPPRQNDNPETATIELWGKGITYAEFQKLLEKVPKTVKIKISSTICYGGGVHSLSRNLGNVCSSAVSAYFQPSQSGDLQEGDFSKGFWKTVGDAKGKTSLAEASLNGFASNNSNNPEQGKLSSFDFVDFVLKKGPYERNWKETSMKETSKNKTGWFYPLPAGFSSALPSDHSIKNSIFNRALEDGICQNCCSNSVQSDIDKLSKLSQTLSDVAQFAAVQNLHQKADRQPAQVSTVFNNVIDDMKKNGHRYLQISKMYEEKYKDLVRRWNAHKDKFKDSWSITKWWYGEGKERANILKEFDMLKSNAQRDLKQYSFNHQMLERLDRLDEFSKKATPKQKEKFVQLLQCEWETL